MSPRSPTSPRKVACRSFIQRAGSYGETVARCNVPIFSIVQGGTVLEPSDLLSKESARRPGGASVPSKCKAKTEMERAGIFAILRIRIHSIIETDWSDRQLVAQADAE